MAIIGASNRFGKWGFNLAATLLVSDFRGPVYLVNPREKIVLGQRAYPSPKDIPGKVDLAVIAVPAQAAIAMVEECGRLGIRNVLLVSSNFKEVGEAGAQLEAQLAEKALAGGVRLVGPNTMGMVSTPAGLEILFMPLGVKPGPVDVISQSGNIGLQIMELSMKEGVGICRFVGSGNEAVLDLADYLAFFGHDPQSKVVVLYIESIRQGEKFLEAAARVSRVKPILALKAGKTAAGAQAARSHSGAVAQSPQMISDLFKQAGIVETQSTEELIDLVKTFSLLKPPEGRRLGVVTLGGGWGVATTDAAALKKLTSGFSFTADDGKTECHPAAFLEPRQSPRPGRDHRPSVPPGGPADPVRRRRGRCPDCPGYADRDAEIFGATFSMEVAFRETGVAFPFLSSRETFR